MRIFALIAALALVSVTSAYAGEARSLSLAGVDQKLPGALGKAAEAPKVVEAPKPPDPPKAAETLVAPPPPPPPAPPAAAAEPAPAYAPRPAITSTKPADKAGQVTFDDKTAAPAAPAAPAAVSTDQPKQAKVEKPKRKRGGGYWNEARIMREVYRYSGYAGMIGGW